MLVAAIDHSPCVFLTTYPRLGGGTRLTGSLAWDAVSHSFDLTKLAQSGTFPSLPATLAC